MHARLLAGLAAALVPAAVAAPPPAGAPFLGGVLTQSRVLYPLQVDRWVAVSEQRPPRQEDGAWVRYLDNRKRRWIDLQFVPGRVHGGDALAAAALAARDGLAAAAQLGGRAVELGPLEHAPLAPLAAEAPSIDAWRIGLRYPDERLASSMLLFAHDLYLVRAQASAGEPPASVASLQRELQDFMRALAGQLRIVSTGACWLPGRVEVVESLPPPDARGVLANRRGFDGVVDAVALRDRVLVSRDEAAHAGELAASLGAALYPGCVAPEAIEPEVPASLREIRIEYRAPGDVAPRGRRVGRPRAPLSGTA